jgi:hypothetical protein
LDYLTNIIGIRLALEELKHKTENNTKNTEVVFKYLDELLDKKETPIVRKQIAYKTANEINN